MTLQELRYLVAVADEHNFARAAEVCHVGQPTLSIQIRKLEESLGVALFDRSHRHATTTPIGDEIIKQARITLRDAEKIRELARGSQDPYSNPLRLGVFPTLGPYLIPHFLPKLLQAYPKLQLYLREDVTANLLEQLHNGQLDAALLALPIQGAGIEVEALFEEPFEVALPARHPLAELAEIRQQDLEAHCVLLLEEGHCLRNQALEICGSGKQDLREEFKATSLETLRQMVAAGVGCTLIPALASTPGALWGLPAGLIEMRPFAYPVPVRTIAMVYRHGFPRRQVLQQLGALIRTELPANIMTIDPDEHATVTNLFA